MLNRGSNLIQLPGIMLRSEGFIPAPLLATASFRIPVPLYSHMISCHKTAIFSAVMVPGTMARLVRARAEGRPEALVFTTMTGFREDFTPRFITETEAEVEYPVPAEFWSAGERARSVMIIHEHDENFTFSWIETIPE